MTRRRQGVEGVAPDFLEQLAPAQAEVAHGTIVHASHDERDRHVAFGEREERQPAQPTQNVGLGESDAGPAVAPPPVSRRAPTPLSVAAAKFLKRTMKKYGCPRSAVPHRLCSYPAATKESGNADRQVVGRRLKQLRGEFTSAVWTRRNPYSGFETQRRSRNSALSECGGTTLTWR